MSTKQPKSDFLALPQIFKDGNHCFRIPSYRRGYSLGNEQRADLIGEIWSKIAHFITKKDWFAIDFTPEKNFPQPITRTDLKQNGFSDSPIIRKVRFTVLEIEEGKYEGIKNLKQKN